MAYTKQTWKNLPSVETPISAARLSHLETQYDEAVSYTDAAITAAVDAALIGPIGEARDAAEAAATAAAGSATSASASKTAAQASAESAADSATSASGSASTATSAATSASASKTAAETAASNAAASATAAASVVSTVEDARDDAVAAASLAEGSKTAAAASASTASAAATDAGTSKTAAEAAASAAATARTAAETARDLAAGSATAASGSATAAAGSASSAESAKTAAEEARDTAEDIALHTGNLVDATATTVPYGTPASVTLTGPLAARVAEFEIPEGAPGAGAVDSVNGKTGTVVLTGPDVGMPGPPTTFNTVVMSNGSNWVEAPLPTLDTFSGSYHNTVSVAPTYIEIVDGNWVYPIVRMELDGNPYDSSLDESFPYHHLFLLWELPEDETVGSPEKSAVELWSKVDDAFVPYKTTRPAGLVTNARLEDRLTGMGSPEYETVVFEPGYLLTDATVVLSRYGKVASLSVFIASGFSAGTWGTIDPFRLANIAKFFPVGADADQIVLYNNNVLVVTAQTDSFSSDKQITITLQSSATASNTGTATWIVAE